MRQTTFSVSLISLALAATFSANASAADVKIGVAEALSGGAAQYGVAIRNGLQMAADEINAAGGVNGNKLQLVVEDEQGKKEEAINVFKKLIFQDNVLMVFGPTLSNSAQAAGRCRHETYHLAAKRTHTVGPRRNCFSCVQAGGFGRA